MKISQKLISKHQNEYTQKNTHYMGNYLLLGDPNLFLPHVKLGILGRGEFKTLVYFHTISVKNLISDIIMISNTT